MHRSKYVLILAGLLIAGLMFTSFSAFGQNASGSLAATVRDPSGAVVPNARVVLKNEDTGAARDTASNSSGFFDISAIQPGAYTLTISAPGFTSHSVVWIALLCTTPIGSSRSYSARSTPIQPEVRTSAASGEA